MTYRGLRAIAARMEVAPVTILRWVKSLDFPAYLTRKSGTALGWVSNDDLIYQWQLRQCEITRRSYRPGHRFEDRRQERYGESIKGVRKGNQKVA